MEAKAHPGLWRHRIIIIIIIIRRRNTTKGKCGPVSSVGTATGYGLDGPGIEFR
jgi:hypothetical protein